jgi:hypothetical protein
MYHWTDREGGLLAETLSPSQARWQVLLVWDPQA